MNAVLQLASIGKRVFPCKPNKQPLVKWPVAATSDPETIAAWWQQWPNAMIGLPCGEDNDLLVIDLDVDKETGEAVGETSLKALGYGQLLNGPRVTTPSGGLHLYFQHWSGARNSVGILGAGIDIRTEGGYVIAAGSEGPQGRYQNEIDWTTLPKLPLGLRARAVPPPKPVSVMQERTADDDEIRELLSYVSADADYQTWLSVLMALHDRFSGSEEGLALADEWSAQGSKYKPGEVAAKWAGFKGSGVTFASLPAIARSYGADLSAIARKHARAADG
ncbi:MAG: bifunctional DNA primase/polymerase [Pseudomonadota bacterium]